jgi:hypothetical protein
MANKGDTVMADATAKSSDLSDLGDLLQTTHSDALVFTETENLALKLYDQLRELELHQSLLRVQETGTSYCPTNLEAHG